MDGPSLVKWIESQLLSSNISKESFYTDSGISSATMAQWRSGLYNPSARSINKAKAFFEKSAKENPVEINPNEVIPGYSDLSDANKVKALEYIMLLLNSQRND